MNRKSSRTCLCTHEFTPFHGGVAVQTRETAAAAARLGLPVVVLAPDYGHAQPDETSPFPIQRYPGTGRLSPLGIWQTAKALMRYRRANPHDRIWLMSYGAIEAALWACSLGWKPGPLAMELVGSELMKFRQRPLRARLAGRLFEAADPIGVNSEFVRGLLARSPFGASAGKSVLTPLAVRTDLPEPVEIARPEDPFVILTLARIHPRKGQLEAARALATLPVSLKQRLLYRVAGSGDAAYLEKVRAACRSYGVPFESIGPVEDRDLARVYGGCDLYLMSSVALAGSVEGFGMTLLEAGYYGKPVVGWRSGGMGEAVREGETGRLVEEGDVDGLGRLIGEMMRDAEACRSMGEAGRRQALARSWDESARRICDSSSSRLAGGRI